MSFLLGGRDKNAPRFAEDILRQLRRASEDMGLTDPQCWKTPFGLGFLYRHAHLGIEKAKWEHWCGWFQPNFPSSELEETIYLTCVPRVFPIEPKWLRDRHTEWKGTLDDPASPFAQGVVWADRVWHSYQRDIQLADPIGIEVQALEKQYLQLFGSAVGKLVGFRVPGRYYRFLIAKTLGEKAFGKILSDAELGAALDKKSN